MFELSNKQEDTMKNYYTIGAVALGLAFPVMGLVLSSAFLAYVSIKAIEKINSVSVS